MSTTERTCLRTYRTGGRLYRVYLRYDPANLLATVREAAKGGFHSAQVPANVLLLEVEPVHEQPKRGRG